MLYKITKIKDNIIVGIGEGDYIPDNDSQYKHEKILKKEYDKIEESFKEKLKDVNSKSKSKKLVN